MFPPFGMMGGMMGMPMPMMTPMMPTPGVMPGVPGMGWYNSLPGRFGRDMLGRGESSCHGCMVGLQKKKG